MDKINVDELFRCFNCDYMVDEPHESECCGKLYCQSCMVDLAYTQCKLCKKSIKLRANIFAKNLLQRVELKCRHHCGGKFTYDEMKLHMYRCESRIFKCTIEFCCFVGRKFELIPHMLENHDIYIMALLENYDDFEEAFEKILKNPIDKRPPKKGSTYNFETEYAYPGILPRLRNIVSSNNNLIHPNDNNGNDFNYDFEQLFNEVNNFNRYDSENYNNLNNYFNSNSELYRRHRSRPFNTDLLPLSLVGNSNIINTGVDYNNMDINLGRDLTNTNTNLNSPLNNSNSINENIPDIIEPQLPLASNEENLISNIDTNNLEVNNLHDQLNNQIINLQNNIDEFRDLSNNIINFRANNPYDSFRLNYNHSDNLSNSNVYDVSCNNEINDVDDDSDVHENNYSINNSENNSNGSDKDEYHRENWA
jgi:hypothetical protein